jgi:hypothetical protein
MGYKNSLRSWQRGKIRLAALKMSKQNHTVIEVTMRVRMDGDRRPICLNCGHSVMSHSERDGKLYCYGCQSLNQKQCGENNGKDA